VLKKHPLHAVISAWDWYNPSPPSHIHGSFHWAHQWSWFTSQHPGSTINRHLSRHRQWMLDNHPDLRWCHHDSSHNLSSQSLSLIWVSLVCASCVKCSASLTATWLSVRCAVICCGIYSKRYWAGCSSVFGTWLWGSAPVQPQKHYWHTTLFQHSLRAR